MRGTSDPNGGNGPTGADVVPEPPPTGGADADDAAIGGDGTVDPAGAPAADDTGAGPDGNPPPGAALPDAVDAGGCTGGANGAPGAPAPNPAFRPREKSDDAAGGPDGIDPAPGDNPAPDAGVGRPPPRPLGTLDAEGIFRPPRPPLDGLPNGTADGPLPLAGATAAGGKTLPPSLNRGGRAETGCGGLPPGSPAASPTGLPSEPTGFSLPFAEPGLPLSSVVPVAGFPSGFNPVGRCAPGCPGSDPGGVSCGMF